MTWLKKVSGRLKQWLLDYLGKVAAVMGVLAIVGALYITGARLYSSIPLHLEAAPLPLTAVQKAQNWVTRARYGYTQCRGNICTHAQKNSEGQIYVIRLSCEEDAAKDCRPH